jgi:hypothetical protein
VIEQRHSNDSGQEAKRETKRGRKTQGQDITVYNLITNP